MQPLTFRGDYHPDYDIAKLEARLEMAVSLGYLSAGKAVAAIAEVTRQAGPHYPWFLTCARLQCAKFFARRMGPATLPQMLGMLAK